MSKHYDAEELVDELKATGDSKLREAADELEWLADEFSSIAVRIQELEDEQWEMESELDKMVEDMSLALSDWQEEQDILADEATGRVRDSKDLSQLGLLDA